MFSDGAIGDGLPSDHVIIGGGFSEDQQQQQQEHQQQPSQHQSQHKKLVRRRLHSGNPYQQRLLNMEEARREIMAALQSHRAAMKEASEQQQQQQKRFRQEAPPPLEGTTLKQIRFRKKLRAYPYNTTSNSFCTDFKSTSFSCPHFPWDYYSSSLMPSPENLEFIFPNKPLGLNLNYHDFNNMNTTLHGDDSNLPIQHSSISYCSSSSASSMGTTTSTLEAPSTSDGRPWAIRATSDTVPKALHLATDGEEMARIHSISNHQKMEWNSKLNSATSAWWLNFLDMKEMSSQVFQAGNDGRGIVGDVLHMFDEALDIPAWLEDKQCLDDFYSEDCLQDAFLPCLDTGEIESVDCEWFS